MKKLKIFPKTFFYTFALMLIITVLANGLIYLLAPQMTMSIEPSTVADSSYTFSAKVNIEQYVAEAVLKALPFSILFCVIISLVCSLFFSKVITIPIKRISSITEKMARLDRTAASDIHSQDEIGILSENINELYQSLLLTIENLEAEKEKVHEAESSKVDFLRAASHELKTPVTAVNAMLENMILGVGKYKNYDEYLVRDIVVTPDSVPVPSFGTSMR